MIMKLLTLEQVQTMRTTLVGKYRRRRGERVFVYSIDGERDDVIIAVPCTDKTFEFFRMSGWSFTMYAHDEGLTLLHEEQIEPTGEWEPGNWPKKSKTVTRNGYTYMPYVPIY